MVLKREGSKGSLSSLSKKVLEKTANKSPSNGSTSGGAATSATPTRRQTIIDLAREANSLFEGGDYAKSMRIYTDVLRLSAEVKDRSLTARILLNVGNVHVSRDEMDKAMQVFSMALRLAREISGDVNDTMPKTAKLSFVADALQNLGLVLLERGDYRKALSKNSEALKLRRNCLEMTIEDGTREGIDMEQNDTVDSILLEISEVLNAIGMCSEREGKYTAAKAAYEESFQIRSSILGEQHLDVALSMFHLGGCYTEMAQYDMAMECLESALQIRRTKLGDTHPDISDTLNSIAGIHLRRGNLNEAMQTCGEAISVARKVGQLDPLKVANALNTLGLTHERMGNLEEALKSYTKALKIKTSNLGENDPSVASTLLNIGNIYYANEDYDAAMIAYMESLSVKERALGEDHPSSAVTLNNIGTVNTSQGKFEQALGYHGRALKLWKKAIGENKDHPSIADTLCCMGAALRGKKSDLEALRYFHQAVEMYNACMTGPSHPGLKNALQNIDILNEKSGKK